MATNPTPKRILVVDDERDICTLISLSLTRMGLDSDTVGSIGEAKIQLEAQHYDLVLSDMRLPDGEGLEIVRYAQKLPTPLPVAVITAHANMENAVEAMKAGAFDYLPKPISRLQLIELVQNGLDLPAPTQATPPTTAPSDPLNKTSSLRDSSPPLLQNDIPDRVHQWLIGETPVMMALKAMLAKLGRSNAPVFIHGESGTGKELVARAVHRLSGRAEAPFIAVNCGAIPESLAESEFFGYRKGAFTGAQTDRDGLFQSAHGGSLFLDEVADLPLSMQVKLLRAIQEKSIRKIGDSKEQNIDVRIISATHHHLKTRVEQGLFRQDLYYRLNVLEVNVPPLRERVPDIALIAQAILKKQSPDINLSESAAQLLANYPFPGNVRELENILERASALCENQCITDADLAHLNL